MDLWLVSVNLALCYLFKHTICQENDAQGRHLRIPAMHEAHTALLDILVDNSVIIHVPSFVLKHILFLKFDNFTKTIWQKGRTYAKHCTFYIYGALGKKAFCRV